MVHSKYPTGHEEPGTPTQTGFCTEGCLSGQIALNAENMGTYIQEKQKWANGAGESES